MQEHIITIIGGGLAGSEAAWQAAERGCYVKLYEMRPGKFSPAHISKDLAELVCSNSFRSADPTSGVGLLKEEMRMCGSFLMKIAEETKVPAGKALAVDRNRFAAQITKNISSHPRIDVIREEITSIPEEAGSPIIIATGPLTSESLTEALKEIAGAGRLYFYDAIAPIVTAESLDKEIIYAASRYDASSDDYLNCPMTEEQYKIFYHELNDAKKTPLKAFEKEKYFEGCLPIEIMAQRGMDTPRFGPMKPVGLPDPKTGEIPYAVVQLRREDEHGNYLNMVGFQTKLAYKEQERVFRLIPGMEHAEFVRLGSVHRNTFICAPEVLKNTLQLQNRDDIFLAGQLTGVEGYVESTAMGLLAGLNATRILKGKKLLVPPRETALGSLISHLSDTPPEMFQPTNVHFGLFPPLEKKVPKRQRGQLRMEKAVKALREWIGTNVLLG